MTYQRGEMRQIEGGRRKLGGTVVEGEGLGMTSLALLQGRFFFRPQHLETVMKQAAGDELVPFEAETAVLSRGLVYSLSWRVLGK